MIIYTNIYLVTALVKQFRYIEHNRLESQTPILRRMLGEPLCNRIR